MSDHDVETISPDEARELMGSAEARVLDLRSMDDIAEGHAPGAIETDTDDLETAVGRATRDGVEIRLLVMGDDDERSAEVASKLEEMGHSAAVIEGGFAAWAGAGNQVQPGSPEYEGPTLKQPGAPAPSGSEDEEDEDGDEGQEDDAPPEDGGTAVEEGQANDE